MDYTEIITEYFPYDTFRKGQKEAINTVLKAFENYDYVILDAPTGMGKSGVARTILDYNVIENGQDAFLLTSTKMLQEQYYTESLNNPHFVNYQTGKGRGNFRCLDSGTLVDCNHGSCQEDSPDGYYKCEYGMYDGNPCKNGGCEYWNQKCECIQSDVAIMNYDVLLSDYPNHYKNRNMMVLDEAHNIDNKIMNRIGLTLNNDRLYNLVKFSLNNKDYEQYDIDYWLNRLNDLNHQLHEHMVNHYIYKHNKRETDQIKRLSDKIDLRLKEIKKNPEFWFVYPNKFEDKIIIKPRDVSGYVKELLLDKSDKHLFMSGSIINKSNFIKYLGLDEDEVYYHKAESSFNIKENNPIIPKYCGSLTYTQKQKTLPKTYEAIEEILAEHELEKGIIHCNSREFRDKIMDNINDIRLISYNSSSEKEEVLEDFKNSVYNDVIVAYSLEEGVDLPYDNISFQIIFKVPYPYLGDPQVRARKEADKDWYIIETIRKLVQTQGRGMRAEDDKCTNYILDSSFKGILRNKLTPQEFKECVKK